MQQELRKSVEYLRRELPEAFEDLPPSIVPPVIPVLGSSVSDFESYLLPPDAAVLDGPNDYCLAESGYTRSDLLGEMRQRSEGSTVDERVKAYGIEALAWYRPYHVTYPDGWGIHILWGSLLDIAGDILEKDCSVGISLAVSAVMHALLCHEEFHHWVEVFATEVEAAAVVPKYIPYLRNVYEALHGDLDQVDESLADRRMALADYGHPAIDRRIRQLSLAGPGAYGEWERFALPRDYREGRSQLASQIHTGVPDPRRVPLRDRMPGRRIGRDSIPTYLVGNPIPPHWKGLLSAIRNLPYSRLYKFLRRDDRTKAWSVPLKPGPHGGTNATITAVDAQGHQHAIPIKVHRHGRVDMGTLKDISTHSGIPLHKIGQRRTRRGGSR